MHNPPSKKSLLADTSPFRRSRHSESIDTAVRVQIGEAEPGKVFSPLDFIHLGSRAAVDKVLSHIVASGVLRRIG